MLAMTNRQKIYKIHYMTKCVCRAISSTRQQFEKKNGLLFFYRRAKQSVTPAVLKV